MDKNTFALSNTREVNKLASTLLLVVCLVVYPVLFILTFIGLFKIDLVQLTIFTIVSLILVILNFILTRKGINPIFLNTSIFL